MKLKLDENLGRTAAEVFRLAEHDVETVCDEGLVGTADTNLIAVCQAEERCLVTLDADFGNPLVFKPSAFAGIAVLYLPAKPTTSDLLLTCRTLVAALKTNSISGKLWSVRRGFIREYQPED